MLEELYQTWSKEQIDEVKRKRAELNVELDAMASYHERTGRQFHWLNPVQQRKEIERYMEEHDLSR